MSACHPEIPHGAGLIMTSVAYFSYLAERDPARYGDMARAMGEDAGGSGDGEGPAAFISALEKLIRDIGMDGLKPEQFGLNKEEAAEIARNSLETMGGLYTLTPVRLTQEDVETIFRNCF